MSFHINLESRYGATKKGRLIFGNLPLGGRARMP